MKITSSTGEALHGLLDDVERSVRALRVELEKAGLERIWHLPQSDPAAQRAMRRLGTFTVAALVDELGWGRTVTVERIRQALRDARICVLVEASGRRPAEYRWIG